MSKEGDNKITPGLIKDLFTEVINSFEPGSRPPVRIYRLMEAFSGREADDVPLDEIVKHFSEKSQPRRQAQNAIGDLNNILENLGSDFEIERVSYYRFRKRRR